MTPLQEKYARISGHMAYEAIYSSDGLALRYRLHSPAAEDGRRYPLVLFLHGMGERGHDNEAQVVNTSGAFIWAAPEIQSEHPCFIACPQCPDNLSWTHPGISGLLIDLVNELCGRLPIDRMRLYVCGLSMGGIGTWNLVANNPGVFAAAMPICGATTPENAAGIGATPLWAFHAARSEEHNV